MEITKKLSKAAKIFQHQQIERIEYVKVQESIRIDKESKGIRLDVFVKDNKDTAFCVEMQTRNEDNLPKRNRYYQGLIDMELGDEASRKSNHTICETRKNLGQGA